MTTPTDKAKWDDVVEIVNQQANDEGLWFVPDSIIEDYLQRALRRLHEAIEGKSSTQCALDALNHAGGGG